MSINVVKIKLPVIKEMVEVAGKPAPSTAHSASPWLAPYVCSGKLRSGSFPGNVYHNCGRVYLTTLCSSKNACIYTYAGAALPPLRKMFPNHSDEEIAERIVPFCSQQDYDYEYTLSGDYILFHNINNAGASFYIELNEDDAIEGCGIDGRYISINKDGRLCTYDDVAKPHFKHNPVTLRDIQKYVTIEGNHFCCRFPERYKVEFLLRKKYWGRGRWGAINHLKYKTRGLLQFQHKISPYYNKNVYLIARVTRKNKKGKRYSQSDWTYFRTVGYDNTAKVVLCDESGAMHSFSYQ